MDFLKKFLKNDSTVVGLCELKRREAINSFNFAFNNGFGRAYAPTSEIPGGALYAKF